MAIPVLRIDRYGRKEQLYICINHNIRKTDMFSPLPQDKRDAKISTYHITIVHQPLL